MRADKSPLLCGTDPVTPTHKTQPKSVSGFNELQMINVTFGED